MGVEAALVSGEQANRSISRKGHPLSIMKILSFHNLPAVSVEAITVPIFILSEILGDAGVIFIYRKIHYYTQA